MKQQQKRLRLVVARLAVLVLAVCFTIPSLLLAQNDGGGSGSEGGGFRGGRRRGGGGRGMDPEMLRQFRQRLGQQQTPAAPGTPGAPNTAPSDAKPADTDKKEGDKTAPPKPDTGPPPVTRAAAFEIPGNLADQRLTVDDKRMVSFNFQGAPWTFVLEEVARTSGMNLDWQQLPGDALNLRSNAKYTVAQARDIINEHLMARGYSAEDCRKILGGNLLRVFREVEQVSKELQVENRPRITDKQPFNK